jgi:hypothetical protein
MSLWTCNRPCSASADLYPEGERQAVIDAAISLGDDIRAAVVPGSH